MNKITGKIDVALDITDIAMINALIERDEPKQASKNDSWLICPTCGYTYIHNDHKFCCKCGQRIDRENYAL